MEVAVLLVCGVAVLIVLGNRWPRKAPAQPRVEPKPEATPELVETPEQKAARVKKEYRDALRLRLQGVFLGIDPKLSDDPYGACTVKKSRRITAQLVGVLEQFLRAGRIFSVWGSVHEPRDIEIFALRVEALLFVGLRRKVNEEICKELKRIRVDAGLVDEAFDDYRENRV